MCFFDTTVNALNTFDAFKTLLLVTNVMTSTRPVMQSKRPDLNVKIHELTEYMTSVQGTHF